MKVLYINPLQERHGSTFRARNLSRLLSKRHRVVYIEPGGYDTGRHVSLSGKNNGGFLLSALRFLEISCREGYDVLFLQKPIILTLPAMIVAKMRRKPVVIDFDDLDSRWQTSVWKRCLSIFGEKVMPRCADVVTTHNRYLRDRLRQWFGEKIALIPQGVDTGLFDPHRYDRAQEKKKLAMTGKIVFCFLGSFTSGSAADLDVIFQAFKKVSTQYPDVCLMILGGGGPLEKHYMAMIDDLELRESVLVTGRKAQHDIPRYLSSADYGLVFMRDNLANRFRMSLKVLEYLSMGLPVIGHVVGGTRESVGRYCLTCKPTVDSLRDMMIYGLKTVSEKDNVRKMMVTHYDWERFIPLLDGVVQMCTSEKRAA